MHNLWKDQDRKVHFKMYKAGKQWVFAGLAVIGLSAGLSMSGGNVRADSNVDGSVPQTEKAVMTDPTPVVGDKTAALPTTELKQAATAPAVEKASDPQAVQTVGETQTGSDAAATPVPAENAPADAKVDGNVSPTVAQPVQDKKAQNNSVDKQVEPYTSTTENNTAAATNPVQSAAQPVKSSYPQLGANEPDNNSQQTVSGLQVQADDAKATGTTAKTDIPDGPGVVTVTPATFLQYFTKHYFNDWDATTGKFGLTMDLPRQAGNTTLQTKMYMGDSFQLKGAVMLGNHEHPETEWADGITFGFNSSPVGSVGKYGSDFGMGGLQNGFGFKLDTYSNPERDDPGKFGKGPGQAYAGGYYPNTDAFGAFAYDAKDNTYRTYNPQSETDPAAPKSLGYGQLEPNKFYPIEIDYDGKSHVMTATFDNTTSGKTLTWSHDVSAWAGNKKALSFIISASTGELYGKQKFQLKSFKYTVSGIANVKFVDEDNNPIPNAPSVSEVYGRLGEATELTDATAAIHKIENEGQYVFKSAQNDGTGQFDQKTDKLTMTKDPQTVTYTFAKNQSAINANDFKMLTGEPWNSDINHVSVIGKDGESLDTSNLKISSNGDNQTPGTYDVTYTLNQVGYQGVSLPSVTKTVHATISENKAKMTVRDTTYNVGDQFDPTKSLISATDRTGKPVSHTDGSILNKVTDTAGHEVDSDKFTSHSGTYDIQFTYKPDGSILSISPKAKITVVQPDNMTVNLVNVKNNETVNTDVPKNHQTDDQIDVTANSPYLKTVIPDGYHYATAGDFTADKVTDKAQPKTNPAYTAKKQTVTVYVAGDTVKPGDANAFTLHDLLKDSNDVKVGKDVSLGGNVGDTVVATVDAAKKAAHPGYTIVPGQKDQSWVLQSKKGSTANFYFTADPQNNITVNVVNAANANIVHRSQPTDHHTGDTLDISQNSSFVQDVKGMGYHYATGSELNGHTQPVKDPVYDTTPKNVNIYVAGDKLTDANALKIHYLKDGTWVSIRPDLKIGGNVGDEIKLPLNDSRLIVPGYKLAPNQKDVKWVLNNSDGQGQPFFYNPESQDNITVHFLDVNNDNPVGNPVNPQGQTGDELNLTKTSTQIHVPEGYHWATDDDLKSNHKTQLSELKWTVAKQVANVYVNGNPIDKNSENALTVDHYLVDDNGKPTSKTIGTPVTIGGRVGQTITINPQDVNYAVPGYTAVGKNVVTRTLGTGKVDPVNLYYAANSTSNITVHDIDVNGDPNKPVWNYIPTGKTGEKLDLNDNKNLNIPVGYHKATGEELNGHTQPADPTYSKSPQTVNVYVAGDMVQNAITVHHLRQDEQGKPTNQTVAPDHPLNIRFGQTYSVDLSKEPQKVNGYTIVPNQVVKPVKVELNTHENVNIYYTGDKASNINVHLIDTNVNGTKFKVQVPAGHTGEVLNLNDKSKVQIPDGYHRSNKSEVPAGKSQSDNPTYTTNEQNVHVYVTGNPIDKNGANALIINHFLADEKGQPTSQSFGTPIRIGGYVGEKIPVDPQSKNYQIDGYTALGKDTIIRTLGTKPVDPVNLYYQANGLNNITVHYLDVNNDNQVGNPVNPEGHTGETLNLGETSTQIHVPEGYHFATNDELKEHKKTQVHELKWSTQKQDANVYVNGNAIGENDKNALTVDHYLVDEKGQPTSTTIGTPVKMGGRVGETLQVDPMSKGNLITGYTVTSKEKVMRTLGTKPVDPVKLYYTGNAVENAVIVHHLRQDEQGKPTNTTVTSDTSLPGTVGQILSVDLSKEPQKINGYTIVPNQVVPSVKVEPNTHKVVNVYYTGDAVEDAVTVHYLRQDEQGKPTTTKVLDDKQLDSNVGETVTVNPSDAPQKANGYTIVPKQPVKSVDVHLNTHEDVNIYYTGDENSNINVHLIDTNVNGTKFKVQMPAGHTGEVLNLNDNSKVQIPDGYHRSNKSEIPTGESQSGNPTYTTKEQNVHVYVTGDPIDKDSQNALVIDHYLADEKGRPTPHSIGTQVRIPGRVGETVTVNPLDKDNQIAGYTVTSKEKVTRTLGTKPVDPVKLYYQANGLSNITVHYLDINNDDKQVGDSVNPEGHTDETLNLDKTSTQIHVPEGYHFATNDELKKHQKTQVHELTWGTQDQNANVYVSGNTIDGNSANALTVDHYLVDEKGQPTSTTIGTPVKIGGHVGDTLQVDPMGKGNLITGYTVTSKAIVTRTLGNGPVDPVKLYYTGNAVENAVTVHHLRQDEQGKPTNTMVTSDTSLPGTVGQTLAVDLSKEPQKVSGYTIVPNQVVKPVKVGLNTHEDVNIYYTGDEASNINVHLIDTHHNGTKFNPETPQGHTGEILNLNDNSKVQIPDGYHRSNKSEIPAGESQSPNPTYTTSEQNVHVYVTGNNIDDTDANALTVNHYVQDNQGQKTTKVIGTVAKMGGYVGKQVTVDPQVAPNVIPGYTPVDKNVVTRVLSNKPQSPVNLYYTANELNTITVKDYDVNGDPNTPVSVNVPTGKTGEQLDLNDNKNLNIPAGYHKATGTELDGHTQPENPTYSTTPKTVNVFVVGDDVNDAVTVHYAVQDETGKPTANELSTDKINSKVGQTVTVNPSGKQPTFDGYTIVPNQATQRFVVTPDTHKQVTIYYTGNANSHVIVHLVDTNSGNTIATDKPEGHTGETLDLNDNSKVTIPDGYHRSDKSELPDGKQQSGNPTYTTKDQNVDVYITGNDITPNDANAVTVHHYLTGTTHPVHDDTKVGGRVGQTVKIDPQADGNAVTGYTPAADQSVQLRTLGTKPVPDVNIYYTPNASNNITIQYVDGNTGKVVATTTPKGYYGNKVDLTNPSVVKAPKGYHLATANELPKGKQQPAVNPTYSNKDQTITIFVFGDYTGNGGTTGGSGVVVPTKTTDQPKASTPANPVVEAPATNDAAPKAQTKVMKKGEVVYSLKNIYLYKNKTFSKKERKAGYVSKPRVYRPMLVVIGHGYSKNGLLRYKVRDVNHLTKNRHLVGYITANFDYVRPVYYQGKHQTITVINPRGVNGYKRKDLTGHSAKYKQGTVLHVSKVVHHNLTTRYVLTNGQYITANRKLVMTGKKKMPRTIRLKRTINRYKDANFTHKNKKRIQRGTKLKVLGYDYSHANSVSKHGTLRYRVAGGYVTGNSKFVKVHY